MFSSTRRSRVNQTNHLSSSHNSKRCIHSGYTKCPHRIYLVCGLYLFHYFCCHQGNFPYQKNCYYFLNPHTYSPLFLLPMFFFTILSQFQIGNLHLLSYLLPHITFPIRSIRHLSDKHSKTSLSFSLPALSSHKASLEAGLLSESSHHLSFDIKMIPI